jgi:hypothetical protein
VWGFAGDAIERKIYRRDYILPMVAVAKALAEQRRQMLHVDVTVTDAECAAADMCR